MLLTLKLTGTGVMHLFVVIYKLIKKIHFRLLISALMKYVFDRLLITLYYTILSRFCQGVIIQIRKFGLYVKNFTFQVDSFVNLINLPDRTAYYSPQYNRNRIYFILE